MICFVAPVTEYEQALTSSFLLWSSRTNKCWLKERSSARVRSAVGMRHAFNSTCTYRRILEVSLNTLPFFSEEPREEHNIKARPKTVASLFICFCANMFYLFNNIQIKSQIMIEKYLHISLLLWTFTFTYVNIYIAHYLYSYSTCLPRHKNFMRKEPGGRVLVHVWRGDVLCVIPITVRFTLTKVKFAPFSG